MSWLTGAVARVRSMILRRSLERDSDEEIRFHLDMEVDKNLRSGMPSGEARRQAYLTFGGVERHRERLRDGRRSLFFDSFFRDLRFALRSLRRDPGFSVVAIVTVALGVGATTVVFSVANSFLFRPLPVPDSHRLHSIQESRVGRTSMGIEGARIVQHLESLAELLRVRLQVPGHRWDVTQVGTNRFGELLVQCVHGKADLQFRGPMSGPHRQRFFLERDARHFEEPISESALPKRETALGFGVDPS